MILIIGLGNPGDKYKNTRHNIGREIVTLLADEMQAEFRFEKKWNTEIAEASLGSQKIVLALPDTFMNKSGTAIGAIARFLKAKPPDILVVHDDADIALGNAKLSFGKRSAGHKGVESLMRALKTREFWRFRVGIAGRKNIPAENLVLKRFTPDEIRMMKKIIKKTIEALGTAITEGPEKTMNTYNQFKNQK